jgi:hypothetical protein
MAYFFQGKICVYINFVKKYTTVWSNFYKLIWSPWLKLIMMSIHYFMSVFGIHVHMNVNICRLVMPKEAKVYVVSFTYFNRQFLKTGMDGP